jgi:hypothetical protein
MDLMEQVVQEAVVLVLHQTHKAVEQVQAVAVQVYLAKALAVLAEFLLTEQAELAALVEQTGLQ